MPENIAPTTAASGVVHALYQARVLCDTIPQPPKDWPAGHTAVVYIEIHKINCSICREKAIELYGQEAG